MTSTSAGTGEVVYEQQQDFLGSPTDGWYWRDDACEEPMGPFDTLDAARADYQAIRQSPSSGTGAAP